MAEGNTVMNYIQGVWTQAEGGSSLAVRNPATQETLATVAFSTPADVERAVASARGALEEWRRTPAVERIQALFRLKMLLEEHLHDLARTITLENGKTLGESLGEMRRAIENVEVACGIPLLGQGAVSEDIARGVDEFMLRQPVGVCAVIAPFNFPAMIPFWFFPYALALGNTVVVKPSERTPLTMLRVFELLEKAGLPAGVMNMVQGGRATSEALIDHPEVKAVSFVGSTAAAKAVYARAAAGGKRAQCGGGAKNPLVVLPDAEMSVASQIVVDSAFGNAGQRCLAASSVITVGEARQTFRDAVVNLAGGLKVGYGLDEGVQMGPVITPESKDRIEGIVTRAEKAGARFLLDGRDIAVNGYSAGNFLGPTVLDDVAAESEAALTEIFGPVLGMTHAETLDEAIALVNGRAYGNEACIFTSSGAAARKFRYEVDAGNVGINIGVAAPMAFFPFSGWNASFFGDLHGQGMDAVEFFTQKKVVVERWPKEWSRKF